MEYVCGYCGQPYHTIGERMNCERTCHDKKVREEEEARASKKNEEMKKDRDNLVALIKERDSLDKKIEETAKEYDKKYGVLTAAQIVPWVRPLDAFFGF